jgi:hypothetical protein
VPSVTAILETVIAVPLYWWIALHAGLVLPLLISAAVAPLLLLRSDQPVALGVKRFIKFDELLLRRNGLLFLFCFFLSSFIWSVSFL